MGFLRTLDRAFSGDPLERDFYRAPFDSVHELEDGRTPRAAPSSSAVAAGAGRERNFALTPAAGLGQELAYIFQELRRGGTNPVDRAQNPIASDRAHVDSELGRI